MEVHQFFLQLMVLLLTARLFAEVAVRIGVPSVIGELLAGVALGPSLLGWLAPNEIFRLLAEIGIILLLFEVGLETDVRRLLRTGTQSTLVALIGFALPFLFGFGLSYWVLDVGLLPALFVGGTLTATSIGVTVRILNDLGRQRSYEGQLVLGAAVLDDILGVVLLGLLYEFSLKQEVSLANVGKVVIFIVVFFALATPTARLLSLLMRRFEAKSEIPGLIPVAIVSLVLFYAWLAHAVGAPELLGGFAAGLALSRRFFLPFGIAIRTERAFADTVEGQMRPIIHLFTPIFFVTVGLSLNLRAVDWGAPAIWGLALSLTAAAVIGKLIAAFVVGERWRRALAIGIAMTPRGEVGLVFAELGRASGILDNELYTGLIIAIAMTTLLAPFALKGFYDRTGRDLPAEEPAEDVR
jgi:Kef-type K+ transport system membrane component KefB